METRAEEAAEYIHSIILGGDKDTDGMAMELRTYFEGLKDKKLQEAIMPLVADEITEKELSMGPRLNFMVRAALPKAEALKKKKSTAVPTIRASAKMSPFVAGGSFKSNVTRRPTAVIGKIAGDGGWQPVMPGEVVVPTIAGMDDTMLHHYDAVDPVEQTQSPAMIGKLTANGSEAANVFGIWKTKVDAFGTGTTSTGSAATKTTPKGTISVKSVHTEAPPPMSNAGETATGTTATCLQTVQEEARPHVTASVTSVPKEAPPPMRVEPMSLPKPGNVRTEGVPLVGRAEVEPLVNRLISTMASGDKVSASCGSLIRALGQLSRDKDLCPVLVECGVLAPLVEVLDADGQDKQILYIGCLSLCFMANNTDKSIVEAMGQMADCLALTIKLVKQPEQCFNASILLSYLANKNKGRAAGALLEGGALAAVLGVIDLVLGEQQITMSKMNPETLLSNGIRAVYHLVANNEEGKRLMTEDLAAVTRLNKVLTRGSTCSAEDQISATSFTEGQFNVLVIISRIITYSPQAIRAIAECGIINTLCSMVMAQDTTPEHRRLSISCLTNLSCTGPEGEEAFIKAGGMDMLAHFLTMGDDFLHECVKFFSGINNFTIDAACAGKLILAGGLRPLISVLASTSVDVRHAAATVLVNFTQTEDHQRLFWDADIMTQLMAALGSDDDDLTATSEAARARRHVAIAVGNILLQPDGIGFIVECGGPAALVPLLHVGGVSSKHDPRLVASIARLGSIISQNEVGLKALLTSGATAMGCQTLTAAAAGSSTNKRDTGVPPKVQRPGGGARKRRPSLMVQAPLREEVTDSSPTEQKNEEWEECMDRMIEFLLHLSVDEEARTEMIAGDVLKILCRRLKKDVDPEPGTTPHPHLNLVKLVFNLCHSDAAVVVMWTLEDWSSSECSLKQIMRIGDPELLELSLSIIQQLHEQPPP